MGQKRLKRHKEESWEHQKATAHCTKYPDTFRRLISVDLYMLLACFIGMVLWPTIIEKGTLAFSFSALSQILLYLLKIQRRLVKDLSFVLFFLKPSKQYTSILYKASLHKPIQPDFCINVI